MGTRGRTGPRTVSCPFASSIFGHISYRSEWELVKVDFRPSFPRPCRAEDYSAWDLTNLQVGGGWAPRRPISLCKDPTCPPRGPGLSSSRKSSRRPGRPDAGPSGVSGSFLESRLLGLSPTRGAVPRAPPNRGARCAGGQGFGSWEGDTAPASDMTWHPVRAGQPRPTSPHTRFHTEGVALAPGGPGGIEMASPGAGRRSPRGGGEPGAQEGPCACHPPSTCYGGPVSGSQAADLLCVHMSPPGPGWLQRPHGACTPGA